MSNTVQFIQQVLGIQGPAGAGIPGSVLRSGPSVPADSLGIDGDYYLNAATGDLSLRMAGVYGVAANLRGPQGVVGATGASGAAGTQGISGAAGSVLRNGSGAPSNGLGVNGDYYLNVATGDLSQRTSGSYVTVGNLKGPAGATGATGAAPTPQGRLQTIATHTQIPNGARHGTDGGRSDQQYMGRRGFYTGKSAVKEIQFGFPGFYSTLGTAEAPLGNDYTMETALEIPAIAAQNSAAAFARAYALGSAITNVPSGTPFILTEPGIGIDIPPNTLCYARTNMVFPSTGSNIPVSASSNGTAGDNGYLSPLATSQIGATGAMTTPAGGVGYGSVAPALILGIAQSPMPAVVCVGDSIPTGTGDIQDGNGNVGFVERGLYNVNGFPVPSHMQVVGGNTFALTTQDKAYRQRSAWKYHTHILGALGTNDIGNSNTLAQLQSYCIAQWLAGKRTIGPYGKALQTAQCTVMPRTASNYKLFGTPTILAGGSSYPASATFNVTIAGGVLASGGSAATVNVTTNAGGVVTTVNSISNAGLYATSPTGYYDGTSVVANSPAGSSGSGLSLGLKFGGWFDAANQTPISGFASGGTRDQFNAWLKTQAGVVNATYGIVLLDAVVDSGAAVEDTGNPGKWVSNGTPGYPTADGIHPTSPNHSLAAAAVNGWATTLTV